MATRSTETAQTEEAPVDYHGKDHQETKDHRRPRAKRKDGNTSLKRTRGRLNSIASVLCSAGCVVSFVSSAPAYRVYPGIFAGRKS